MRGSKRVVFGFTALTLPWLLAGSAATYADEDSAFNRTPRDCVITQSIARTDILDDQTIIFYMRGKNVAYRNYLPKKCPGLKRWDRFGYHVTAGRLCSIDTITVLENAAVGVGFGNGFTCRLGDFHPLSPEDIASLKIEKEGGGVRPDAVKATPAEVPPAANGDGDAAPQSKE
ncbi:MAG: hypothetical protein ABI640_12300 [Gammaproteobacteria bacterium]